jgi:hypothetical protein
MTATPDIASWRWSTSYTLPLLNEYVILFDSTRSFYEKVANSTSLVATAGSYRMLHDGCRFDLIVGSTGQNVTFVRQIWNGSAWETVSSGSDTLTAGTTYPYGWVPEAPDYRMYLLAGATAPTTVIFECTITRGDRAAGT